MVGEEIRHYLSHIGGFETFVYNLFDIATVLYRGNGGSISRRSADSLGFKFFYQACFAVTWRWFGEKLFRVKILERKTLALFDTWQD